jgi:plasmid maintenance system antidote protein VapI
LTRATASINELLRGHRAVQPGNGSPSRAVFGTAPELWLNAQRSVDLWDAARHIRQDMERITALRVAWRGRDPFGSIRAHPAFIEMIRSMG